MGTKFSGVHEKPLDDPENMDVVGPAGDRITIPVQDFEWYQDQGYEEASEWSDPGTFYEINELSSNGDFEFIDEDDNIVDE